MVNDVHSLMSGKYAQKREMGSRTVCLEWDIRIGVFDERSCLIGTWGRLPERPIESFDGLRI